MIAHVAVPDPRPLGLPKQLSHALLLGALRSLVRAWWDRCPHMTRPWLAAANRRRREAIEAGDLLYPNDAAGPLDAHRGGLSRARRVETG